MLVEKKELDKVEELLKQQEQKKKALLAQNKLRAQALLLSISESFVEKGYISK